MTVQAIKSNFSFLRKHDEQLMRLGMLAEKHFFDDPNSSLIKTRQFAEYMAQLIAARWGVGSPEMSQHELLRALRYDLPRDVRDWFHHIRKMGNDAAHEFVHKDAQSERNQALSNLKHARRLALWYYRAFVDSRYKSQVPFIPPQAPLDESKELRAELEQLQREFEHYQSQHQQSQQALEHEMQALEQSLTASRESSEFWEQMALESEDNKATMEQKLAEQRQLFATYNSQDREKAIRHAEEVAQMLELSESETRQHLDVQLCEAGWQADSVNLHYAKGTRPEKGRNLAIAEYPVAGGKADYMLFIGMMPVAIVEVKSSQHNVVGALEQAKRYSRDFTPTDDITIPAGSPWQEKYHIPFLFASNGRAYMRSHTSMSGMFFIDVRRASNLERPIAGWHTPATVAQWLKHDSLKADNVLERTSYENYELKLRDYQKEAIAAVERAIANGQRSILLAMATGTGKTKTAITLIYRLLKAQRFQRILFLADRSALVEQSVAAFKETRFENLQSFADTFGIDHSGEDVPSADTATHVATVQSLVHQLFEGQSSLPIDRYDCIIVDECHRGYKLDRDMTELEQQYRSFEDYVSKYRQVIEHFDAVKIGLTATPALHTSQIFGVPVYQYSYRRAVLEGFLIDHDPPMQIDTKLAVEGMHWHAGEQLKKMDLLTGELTMAELEDEMNIPIDKFNSLAITEEFNRVVCEELAKELHPYAEGKTLIFCVNDHHADTVVHQLKIALQHKYGEAITDRTVMKITGKADKPNDLIRHYKNEALPRIAVTVDLLTTGIDVPHICNLVFLRRVRSRILYEQMLGRATRRADDIGKERFRIFDAVRIYEALEDITDMKPVVQQVQQSFHQLIAEISRIPSEEMQESSRDQLVAKIQRKKTQLENPDTTMAQEVEILTGIKASALAETVATMPLETLADWLEQHPMLGDILDKKPPKKREVIVSEHKDALHSRNYGYGKGQKPADYLESFKQFLQDNRDTLPALSVIVTRPSDLKRSDLKKLLLELSNHDYTERNLRAAHHNISDLELSASMIGYIRAALLDEPLVAFESRVDAAYHRLRKQAEWNQGQLYWLDIFAKQTKQQNILDREALEAPDTIFQRKGGGFARLNKTFDGELEQILHNFNDHIWQAANLN